MGAIAPDVSKTGSGPGPGLAQHRAIASVDQAPSEEPDLRLPDGLDAHDFLRHQHGHARFDWAA